jgi:hypothetical protein
MRKMPYMNSRRKSLLVKAKGDEMEREARRTRRREMFEKHKNYEQKYFWCFSRLTSRRRRRRLSFWLWALLHRYTSPLPGPAQAMSEKKEQKNTSNIESG